MNITTIELPIYNLDIVILIDNWEEANKKFKLGLDEDWYLSHAITMTHPVYTDKYEIFLLLRKPYLDYNTVLHELHHVLNMFCNCKGIIPDPENDEALAYLQGYIGEKILKFRDKYLKESKTLQDYEYSNL